MKPSTRNIAKGAGREIKGKVKEAAGRITGNTRLRAKGQLQSAAGRVQRKMGEAQRDLDKELEKDID
jgi:uncharacterized protein YjbJ (UPF0337 family)